MTMYAGGEFDSMGGGICSISTCDMNVVSKGEGVLEFEKFVRTVKYQTCCTYNMVSLTLMETRTIFEMVYVSVFLLNNLPSTYGILDMMIPQGPKEGNILTTNGTSVMSLTNMCRHRSNMILKW